MRTGDTLDLPLAESRKVFTVSGLNREARLLIEGGLGVVWVEGEISNLARPSSGHLYWTLKDAQAQVRCAMFRQYNRLLSARLENGQQVLVRGRVSLYEARGEFQLVIESVEEAGEGLLRRRFEELKRKLAAEGLFDTARKQAVPAVPRRIGIITSPTGAAVRDVLAVLGRRFPAVPVLVYPTAVQGAAAVAEICRTIELADMRAECDVLILARGGGSLEDLWAFNEEAVARTISGVRLPIIVGVGHEVDFTIADFVADLRAPTPSQAAELAVPDQAEWTIRLERIAERLVRTIRRRQDQESRALEALVHRLHRCHPSVPLRELHQRLDEIDARLRSALRHRLNDRLIRVARLGAALSEATPLQRLKEASERCRWVAQRLELAVRGRLGDRVGRVSLAERALRSLSPLATLERGYAIVSRLGADSVLRDSAAAPPGSAIRVRLARGSLTATVEKTEPSE
jgi:exodeoxyribonuclease VII large subunit